ncbi:hypothetical protein M0R45_016597 [Rubus argutus]|uniref:Uncharacterized protein n=1 Tax=Rubus argutus TaxID=59490 RepID=A0AAW1XWN2_RUBAR
MAAGEQIDAGCVGWNWLRHGEGFMVGLLQVFGMPRGGGTVVQGTTAVVSSMAWLDCNGGSLGGDGGLWVLQMLPRWLGEAMDGGEEIHGLGELVIGRGQRHGLERKGRQEEKSDGDVGKNGGRGGPRVVW